MFGLNPFERPRSSYERPVPLVFVDPADAPDYLVCFRKEWLPYILGSLMQLTLETTWKTDDKEELATMLERVNALLSLFINGCEGGDNVLIEALPDGCGIRYSFDGGVTWTNVETFDCVGATGATGAPGADGADGATGATGAPGADGADGEDCTGCGNHPDPSGADGAGKRCNVAYGVTQWLFEKYNDGLDLLDSLIALDREVADMVSDIIEAIPVVGAFAEFTVDFVTNIAEADTAVLRACDTTDFRDTVFCDLYCILPDDGIITDAVLSDWADAVETDGDCASLSTTIGAGLKNIIKAIGGANFRQRGYIFSTADAPCPACDDCDVELCRVWDFETEAGEFHLLSIGLDGSYSAGNGYVTSSNGTETAIHLACDYSVHIKYMKVHVEGDSSGGGHVDLIYGDPTSGIGDWHSFGSGGFGTGDVSASTDNDGYPVVNVYSPSGNHPLTIKSLELHWTGSDPFSTGTLC